MKISRLFSILIYLLNRDLVSARELAERFEVSVRTIQRDIDALCAAGIPVLSAQGSHGGYGIVEEYKLDRQMIDTSDLFFILTALESIGTTYQNRQIADTLEKVKTFVHGCREEELESFRDKLFIDFSALSLGKESSALFCLLEQGIDDNRLVTFDYTSAKNETTRRIVEPMTIAFKWFSWYLFGYCRLRDDYRLFRLSRIRNLTVKDERFTRRERTLSDCSQNVWGMHFVEVILKFHPSMSTHVHDYFRHALVETEGDGSIIVTQRYPEDAGVIGMILSYGDKVEVLSPERLRKTILQQSSSIVKKYK